MSSSAAIGARRSFDLALATVGTLAASCAHLAGPEVPQRARERRAGEVVYDAATRTATLTDAGHTLALRVRLDQRCFVDRLTVLGREVLAPETGACTAVELGDTWYTTRSGLASPQVECDGASLLVRGIAFGPPEFPVTEEWRFTAADDQIDWAITRTYRASGELHDTYFPGFDFASPETWTGGILATGGVAWMRYLDTPCASYGSHSGSVRFWNQDSQDCLCLASTLSSSARDVTARFSRHPGGVLSANFWPSDTELVPAHGLARFLPDRLDLWRGAPIAADPTHPRTITSTLTLAARRYDEVSNLGTLAGVDGRAVRELLNTIARYGVIDRGIAGSNGWRSSFTCTHEPWIAEFGLALPDPDLIANYTRTLDEIQRAAITPEGRVLARWHSDAGDAQPGTFDPATGYYEAQWGLMLDSQPSYVVCVAEQFDLNGDLGWLRAHRDSCRAALEYLLARDEDHDGLLEVIPQTHREERGSDWIDIVWASHENALVNAEMFEALERWSELEALLGDRSHAERYRAAARTLQLAFNRPVAEGGFWNPERNWYVHWREPDGSIHGDNLVTPVNFAAIGYGVCDDPARRAAILGQIEARMETEQLFHWPLCFLPYRPEDVYERQKSFPVYENGDLFLGWAELAVRSYASSDPALAMRYIHKVLERYNQDGLSFQRCLRTNAEGSGDDILANNAMAIVGLYRDIYGVRPRHDRLFLDPHLTPELNGTSLRYPLRGTPYTIGLATDRCRIAAEGIGVASPRAFGVDIAAGRVRCFRTLDEPAELTLAAEPGAAFEVEIEPWPVAASAKPRVWSLRSATGSRIAIRHAITGLPASTAFTLRRDGEVVAHVRSDTSGSVELRVTNVAGSTRLVLQP